MGCHGNAQFDGTDFGFLLRDSITAPDTLWVPPNIVKKIKNYVDDLQEEDWIEKPSLLR